MIYFIGAGPGDPELMTVKGARLLGRCHVVIYAGSLVNPKVLDYARHDSIIYDSAGMNLEEVIEVIQRAHSQGQDVARVHTGDPCIYGAIREQMVSLDKLHIPFEVIPGVSSFTASSAALQRELTLPGASQTVIITRAEGRTPVPAGEDLKSLAKAKATMAIFLSVDKIQRVVEDLAGSYRLTTPVAVVYKATWEDQKIVRGTLENIAKKVEREGIQKTALILVGDFLGDEFEYSKLYDKGFTHGYRQGTED